MRDIGQLLRVLQHADSFFPSGSVAFSWGLETLHSDGKMQGAPNVEAFLIGQINHRWLPCDRIVLAQAYAAMPDIHAVKRIDRSLEALSLAREGREGSRRAGSALLRIHAQLDTPFAQAYRERVQDGDACGHLPVMQGMLWQACGISRDAALAASAHSLCVGVLGAAIRLGALGHIDAQLILQRATLAIDEAAPFAPADVPSTFVPEAEIAMLKHETQHARLFVN